MIGVPGSYGFQTEATAARAETSPAVAGFLGARAALPCRPEVPLVVFFKLSMLTMDGGAAVSGGPLTVQSTAVLTAAFHVE